MSSQSEILAEIPFDEKVLSEWLLKPLHTREEEQQQ